MKEKERREGGRNEGQREERMKGKKAGSISKERKREVEKEGYNKGHEIVPNTE